MRLRSFHGFRHRTWTRFLFIEKNILLRAKKRLKKAGISECIIEELQPYISYHLPMPVHFTTRQRLQLKDNTDYDSPLKFYQKYQANWRNFSLYFLSQKDEGEKEWIDYWSAALYVKRTWFCEEFCSGQLQVIFRARNTFCSQTGALERRKCNSPANQTLSGYKTLYIHK